MVEIGGQSAACQLQSGAEKIEAVLGGADAGAGKRQIGEAGLAQVLRDATAQIGAEVEVGEAGSVETNLADGVKRAADGGALHGQDAEGLIKIDGGGDGAGDGEVIGAQFGDGGGGDEGKEIGERDVAVELVV